MRWKIEMIHQLQRNVKSNTFWKWKTNERETIWILLWKSDLLEPKSNLNKDSKSIGDSVQLDAMLM